MLRDILSIGDKIDIRKLDHTGRPHNSGSSYVSQLADIEDDEVINIAAPMKNGYIFLPEIGNNYNLCFYTNKGLYQCNCNVIKNFKENNVVFSQVRVITDLEKYQRRQYYRLECIQDIEYRFVTPEEELLQYKLQQQNYKSSIERNDIMKKLDTLEKDWRNALIIDLSGGGARFNSTFSHHNGEKIRIKMELPLTGGSRELNLGAVIVSSNRLVNRYGAYEHRVEFTDIGKKDREDLIKYIFEQDRRRRRNEKG